MTMRLTLVSPYDPFPTACEADQVRVGGVERVFGELSRQLARRGHAVTLLCSTQGAARTSNEDGVNVVRVHRAGSFLGAPLVNLAHRIPANSDLVHVPATYPFTTPAVLRRAHKLGIPCVLDFHFEPHPPTGIGRVAAALYREVGPPAYGLADVVLLRSLAYGRRAASLAEVPEASWRVVPNGIDPARFNPEGSARKGDYILFVGRLVPYKGVEVLLSALARLPDAPPLIVAGQGPSEVGLKRLARQLGVAVTFLGRVPDDELPGLYRGACATILPSIAPQEAFGLSLLESMACGTPVVASDLPGVDEVARLGGVLARPGDAADLAEKLRTIDRENVFLRGPKLAARIHRSFSWDAVAGRLLSVYAEVLERPIHDRTGVTRIAHPRGDPVLSS